MHFQLGAKQPMVWPSTRMRSGKFAKRVQFVGILPGAGKSHALAALGHELVLHCHAVLWTPTASLVQQLLAAKRDLLLPHLVAKLDRYECVFLDDIGLNEHSAPAAEQRPSWAGAIDTPLERPPAKQYRRNTRWAARRCAARSSAGVRHAGAGATSAMCVCGPRHLRWRALRHPACVR